MDEFELDDFWTLVALDYQGACLDPDDDPCPICGGDHDRTSPQDCPGGGRAVAAYWTAMEDDQAPRAAYPGEYGGPGRRPGETAGEWTGRYLGERRDV